jgi:hypothetical protein
MKILAALVLLAVLLMPASVAAKEATVALEISSMT